MIWLANIVITKSSNVKYKKYNISENFLDIHLVFISVLENSLRQKLRNFKFYKETF